MSFAFGNPLLRIATLGLSLAACTGGRPEAPAVTPSILTVGETEARVGAAEAERGVAAAELRDAAESVALEASTASIGVGRDVALLRLAVEYERWLEGFLEEVRERQRQGLASATDVAQVESRLALARATRVRFAGNLEESEARYLSVVGQPPPGSDSPHETERP